MNPDAEILYPEYLKDWSKNKTISLTTSDAKISHFENSDQILPYPVENEFRHLNLSTGVLDSSNVPNCRVCDEVRDLDVNWFHYLDKMVADHEAILRSEKSNFQECRIPVLSHLNIEFFKFMLSDYEDADTCTLLEYGFPIGYENLETTYTGRPVNNHKGALTDMDKYLIKEISKKAVLGPFHSNPFSHEIAISPLNSVPKKGSEDRRVILDLSVREGGAINGFIDKDNYLEEEVNLKYHNVDVLVDLIKKQGRNCLIFKRDLSRAYRQIVIDLHDVHLVGYTWNEHLYFDRVLSLGLTYAAHVCQRVTKCSFLHVPATWF